MVFAVSSFGFRTRPALEGNLAQLLRQLRLERVRMHISHRVEQLRHLLLARANNLGIRMAGCCHAKRGGQIKILFPLGIPDMHALGTVPHDGPCAVRVNIGDVARLEVTELLQDGCCACHKFMIYDLRFTRRKSVNRKSQIINRKSLDASLLRRPDDFVQLRLEAHGQGVGDDALGELLARDGCLARRNGLQRLVLLLGAERMHP